MADIGVRPHLAPESIRLTRPPSLALAPTAQRQLQAFVETMPDGTRVLYRSGGTPLRQWNADDSIVTFDRQGRPAPGTTAHGMHHPSPGPAPTTPRTPLVVDQQHGQARPVGVTFPHGTRARYEYQPDGGRVVHYSTGVVTTEDGAGRILAERLPDGTVLNAFDREGRPIGGTAPGGRPLRLQQPIDAPAMPPGVDPAGPVVRQVTAEGTGSTGSTVRAARPPRPAASRRSNR